MRTRPTKEGWTGTSSTSGIRWKSMWTSALIALDDPECRAMRHSVAFRMRLVGCPGSELVMGADRLALRECDPRKGRRQFQLAPHTAQLLRHRTVAPIQAALDHMLDPRHEHMRQELEIARVVIVLN